MSDNDWSGVRRGPLQEGEWVRLTDRKGRRHSIQLTPGKRFFTSRGQIEHDELIGRTEGFTVVSSGGQRIPRLPTAPERVRGVDAARGGGGLPQGRRPDRGVRRHLPRGAGRGGRRRVGRADLLAAARGRAHGARQLLRAARRLRRHRARQRHRVLRRRAPGVAADRGGPERGTGRDGGRPRRARHAGPVGVRGPGRRRRSRRAGWCARTWRPRRRWDGRWRRCAPTEGSPSRTPGRRPAATGTSRAWPSGPATEPVATPASSSPRDASVPGRGLRCASAGRLLEPTDRTTPVPVRRALPAAAAEEPTDG